MSHGAKQIELVRRRRVTDLVLWSGLGLLTGHGHGTCKRAVVRPLDMERRELATGGRGGVET